MEFQSRSATNALSVSRTPRDDAFRTNIGEPTYTLVIGGVTQRVPIPPPARPYYILGRSDDCDITLPHPDISTRHAYLQFFGGHLYCIDLGSRTGLVWGKDRRHSGWVRPGEPVRLGPYSLVANAPQATTRTDDILDSDLLASADFPRFTTQPVDILFLNSKRDVDGTARMPISRVVTLIGNGPPSKVLTDDPRVATVHCGLVATSAGVYVADLLGPGGTWVNEKPADFQLLQDGDQMRIGGVCMAVQTRPNHSPVHEHVAPQPPVAAPDLAPPPTTGMSEGFVLSLLDRVGAMQQQLTAMNQQQMTLMSHLMGTMQQNHHEVVQQELSRIHQLNTQIQEIQLRISAEKPAEAEDDATPRIGEELLPRGPALAGIEAEGEAAAGEQAPVLKLPKPAAPAANGRDEKPAEDTAGDAPDESQRTTSGDIENHAELLERMSSLERERTSRWKKIMGVLTGTRS